MPSYWTLLRNIESNTDLYFFWIRNSATGNNVKIPGIVIDDWLLRNLTNLVCFNTLRSSYFSFSHRCINFGILLWCYSCHSRRFLQLKKKLIRIIAVAGYRDHCTLLIKKLAIMYITSLLINAIVQEIHTNNETLSTNSDIHS